MTGLASPAQPFADRLVDDLRAAGAVHTPAVAAALAEIPRHWFTPTLEPAEGQRVQVPLDGTPADLLHAIYSDAPLVITQDPFAMSPQPRVVARLLEALDLRPGHRVAVLGEQTGWLPALTGRVVGSHGLVRVSQPSPTLTTSVQMLLTRVAHPDTRVVTRPLTDGIVEDAPFHRLAVMLGCGEVAPAWLEQVAPGGALLVPVFLAWVGVVLRLQRLPNEWTARLTQVARFPEADGSLTPDEVDPLEADTTPELTEFFARPVREVELALPARGAEAWEQAAAFGLYLAVHDPRCVLVSGPAAGEQALRFGLWDRDGGSLALYNPSAQLASGLGNSPLALLQLRGHHRHWVERGFPGCEAYQVTVEAGDARGPGEGGWRADERGATLPLGALTVRVTLE